MGLEVRAVLDVAIDPLTPYVKKNEDGTEGFSIASFLGDGLLYVGLAAQDAAGDATATPGVDVLSVVRFNVSAFKARAPELFRAIPGLRAGDQVEVWLDLEWSFEKRVFRLMATAMKVLHRAPAASAGGARRPAFVDASA